METWMNQAEQLEIELAQQQREAVEKAKAALQIVAGGIRLLNARLLTLLALVSAIGMFAWACSQPSPERLMVAAAFAVLVFLPVLYWARASFKGD
jgi:hypothetical protein